MSIINNLKKNFFYVAQSTVLTSVFGFISLLIISDDLPIKEFGEFVLVLTLIEFISKFFSITTWASIVKYGARYKKVDYKIAFYYYCLFLSSVTSLIVFFIFLFNNEIILNDILSIKNSDVLIYLSIIILTNIYETTVGFYRLENKFNYLRNINITASFIRMLLFLFVESMNYGLKGYVIAHNVSQIFLLTISVLIIYLEYEVKLKIYKNKSIYKNIVLNSIDMSIRNISRTIDVILIGYLTSSENVALFKMIKEFGKMVSKILEPLYQILLPEFSLLNKSKISNKSVNLLRKMTNKLIFITGFMLFLYLLISEELINILLNESYKNIFGYSIPYVIGIFIALATTCYYPMAYSVGKFKQMMLNQLFSTALYLMLVVLLTPNYGVMGASVSFLIYYLVSTFFVVILIEKSISNVRNIRCK